MAEKKITAAPAATTIGPGRARVKILHETFVPAEKGGHQKVLAGAIVEVSEAESSHLILHGKAEASA